MTARTPEPPDFPASQLFLRRLAFSLVHDEARAEDLVQDTWATWVAHRPSGLAEPRAWLARVLRNRAFNVKRGDERRAEREGLAGQPDPSTPETDGTLEAQAQLLEALRKLDEPYRSALVQRYYHDLSPREIADRSGTPLNTVKARLVRGLERLRGEMDRRYGDDRGAWCHWLALLNSPAVPVAVPGGSGGAAQGAAPFAGMGGGLSLVGFLGLAAALAALAVVRSGWLSSAREEKGSADQRRTSAPSRGDGTVSSELGRLPVGRAERERARGQPAPERPASQRPAPELAAPEKSVSVVPAPPSWFGGGATGSSEREDFDWPQYAGGADHDTYRKREDELQAPEVLWFLPGCAGQPTLRDGDLYTGGLTLARIDPVTGTLEGLALELLADEFGLAALFERDGDGGLRPRPDASGLETQRFLESSGKLAQLDPNDAALHTVAPAPVITKELVLARRTRDGGVSAFDRQLTREVWSWDSDTGGGPCAQVPLCLADEELVLVAQESQLTALSVTDGREVWRFTCDGEILAVPACADGRVFFGTEVGLFFALSVRTGAKLWQTRASSLGWSIPVAVGERVLVADRGRAPWELPPNGIEAAGLARGYLYAFDGQSGREIWEAPFEGSRLSSLGIGPDRRYAVAGFAQEVASFDLGSGERDPRSRIATGRHPFGSPTVVGRSVVFGNLDGQLYVYRNGHLQWAFRVPGQVFDFVHTGKRIYVSTSIGLFCLSDVESPTPRRYRDGFVLAWQGDPREPSFLVEDR